MLSQFFTHITNKAVAFIGFCLLFSLNIFAQTEQEKEQMEAEKKSAENIANEKFVALSEHANKLSDSAEALLNIKGDKKTKKLNKSAADDLLKKAISEYKEAMEINPGVYPVCYRLGIAQLRVEKYRSAIKNFEKCKFLDTTKNDPYRESGMAYLGRGKLEKAMAQFDSAVDKNYDDYEAFYQRGLMKEASKNKQPAIGDYTRAIEINPQFSKAYYRRAVLHYSDLKDFKYANHDIKKAVQYDSANIELYYWLGKIKFSIDEFADAEIALTHYLEDSEDSLNVDALVTRGAARLNLNKYTKAIADFNKALSLDKNNYIAYTNRGLAKGCLKQYKEAMLDLDRAVELKFDFSPIYINRALVKFAMRDKDGACKDLKKAQSLNNIKADDLIEQYCPK